MKLILKKLLRPLYRFYKKYFSEVGYLTREVNYAISYLRHYPTISAQRRAATGIKLNPQEQALADMLTAQGAVKTNLQAFSIGPEIIESLTRQAKKFGTPTAEEISKMRQGASKTYWYDLFNPEEPDYFPLKALATHPRILAVITRYLGQEPTLQQIAFYYSPAGNAASDKLIGSQGWHLDNDMKKRAKIFISPFEMMAENGPTTYLPAPFSLQSRYNNYPDYFNDQDAQAFGIDISKRQEMLAQPGEFYFADTSRCYHYGARNQTLPRYLAIITYAPLQSHLNVLKKKHFITLPTTAAAA